MSSILRMVAVLSILCALSGFLLSEIKIGTADRIENQVLTYVQGPALDMIFADADNDPVAERQVLSTADGRKVSVFPALAGGRLYAVGIENASPGYGGDLGVMVGFDVSRDALIGIGITTSKETVGIGSMVTEPMYTNQFQGMAYPVNLRSQGGEVDAVSGATVSSGASVEAVKKATDDYLELREQILAIWPQ